jgi:hypothetical protein
VCGDDPISQRIDKKSSSVQSFFGIAAENSDSLAFQHHQKISQSSALKKINGLCYKESEFSPALFSIYNQRQECCLCNEQKVYHSSMSISLLEGPKSHTALIRDNLEKKYLTSREYYNVKIINDIIYNE